MLVSERREDSDGGKYADLTWYFVLLDLARIGTLPNAVFGRPLLGGRTSTSPAHNPVARMSSQDSFLVSM